MFGLSQKTLSSSGSQYIACQHGSQLPHLAFAKFYAGAKGFNLGLHARYFCIQYFSELFSLGKENHIWNMTKLRLKNHRRGRTNFKDYFMNRHNVGISRWCSRFEVSLEMLPMNFWILPFKFWILHQEQYKSTFESHFPFCSDSYARWSECVNVFLWPQRSLRNTPKTNQVAKIGNNDVSPRFWETEFSRIDWIQSNP